MRAAGLNRGEFIVGHGLTSAGRGEAGGAGGGGRGRLGSGERVMGRAPGAFAEYALMDAREAIPIPAGLSLGSRRPSIPLTFMVVHDMLVEQGGLKAGEWLLVTGVSSGVGVAALQAAQGAGREGHRHLGFRGKARAKLKSLGLDVGLRTRSADFSTSGA